MAKQIVDTVRINSSINKLRAVNGNINSAFDTLKGKANKLSGWKGGAGTKAQTALHQLFESNEARSTVLQNYINLLEQQVSPGYKDTETVNIKLADQFK
ncbi:MAG: hypothetical protein FWH04_06605 [Oscillospiraceae bacterium]|nr:hypothetical protein [Oscillospiraceae bacterium]